MLRPSQLSDTASRRVPLLSICAALFLLSNSCPQAMCQGPSAADRQYISRLAELGLFGLAEEYGQQKQLSAGDPANQARWRIQQLQIQRARLWILDESERQARILESLTQNVQSATTVDAVVRVEHFCQMARLVIEESEVALILINAGRLNREVNAMEPDRSGAAVRVNNLSAMLERLDKLTAAMTSSRSSYSRDELSYFRSQLKWLAAELQVQICLWKQHLKQTDVPALIEEVATTIRSLRRASGSQIIVESELLNLKFAARFSDRQQLQLAIQAVRNQSDTLEFDIGVEVIGFLLRQREPEEAAERLGDLTANSRRQRSCVAWLNCEIALQRLVHAHQLSDDALQTEAARRFRETVSQSLMASEGVFQLASQEVSRSGELVRRFGYSLAMSLERTERLVRAGRQLEALQVLRRILQTQPANSEDSTVATLQLKAAELATQAERYDEARPFADQAATMFEQQGNVNGASTADLLLCFITSRLVASGQAEQSVYQERLTEHLERFRGQPTSRQAFRWLLQSVSRSEPEMQIDVIAKRASDETDPVERAYLKSEFSYAALSLLASDRPVLISQVTDWQDTLARLNSGPHEADLVQILSVAMGLLAGLDDSSNDLSLGDEAIAVPHGIDAGRFWPGLLTLVVRAIENRPIRELNELKAALMDLSVSDRLSCLNFLHRLLNSTASRLNESENGRVYLAKVAESLMSGLLAEQAKSSELAIRLLPMVCTTVRDTEDGRLMQAVIEAVQLDTLSPEQLERLLPVLGQMTAATNDAVLRSVLFQVWQRVIESQTPGGDAWLEGWLQLAELASGRPESDRIVRQLRSINILYPTWGDDASKAKRAAKWMAKDSDAKSK